MGDKKVWKDLEKHLYNSKVDEYGNLQKETSINPNWNPPVHLGKKVHTGYFQ